MPNPPARVFGLALSLISLAACSGADTGGSPDNEAMPVMAEFDLGAHLALACSGCHTQANGAIASLTTYSEADLVSAMLRYKSESEGTTVMHRLARGYSESEIEAVSAHLAAAPRTP
jgi:cytochrome subunit of sulfide dehydrogenase